MRNKMLFVVGLALSVSSGFAMAATVQNQPHCGKYPLNDHAECCYKNSAYSRGATVKGASGILRCERNPQGMTIKFGAKPVLQWVKVK